MKRSLHNRVVSKIIILSVCFFFFFILQKTNKISPENESKEKQCCSYKVNVSFLFLYFEHQSHHFFIEMKSVVQITSCVCTKTVI